MLPVETKTTLGLNGVLLFTVALEPFIFNILRSGNTARHVAVTLYEAASSSFGVDVGAMMLIMGVFTLALADEEKRLVPGSMTRGIRSEAVAWFLSSAIFLISTVPVFGKTQFAGTQVTGVTVRTAMWLVALMISWIRSDIKESQWPSDN